MLDNNSPTKGTEIWEQLEMFDVQPTDDLATKTIGLLNQLLRWKPEIEEALGHAKHSHHFDHVVAKVLSGQLHYYDFGKCMFLMQVIEYPNFKNYHCFIGCGDMQAMKDHYEDMRDIAKKLGCAYLSVTGRLGWPREMKKHGWEHVFSTMYSEV